MSFVECAERPEINFAVRIAKTITNRYSPALDDFRHGYSGYSNEVDEYGWPHVRRKGGYAPAEKAVCIDAHIGQLIELLGMAGLRGLLRLPDDEFRLVMQEPEQDEAVHVPELEQRVNLLSQIETHHGACRRCQLVNKNHEGFANMFESVMKAHGSELEDTICTPDLRIRANARIHRPAPTTRCIPRL